MMMAGRISLSMANLHYSFPSLRGAERRSNPFFCGPMDCFAALAMTGLGRCKVALAMTGVGQMQGGDGEVDRLDADKGNDDAADAVDHQVALQQRAGADGAILHALQRQGN